MAWIAALAVFLASPGIVQVFLAAMALSGLWSWLLCLGFLWLVKRQGSRWRGARGVELLTGIAVVVDFACWVAIWLHPLALDRLPIGVTGMVLTSAGSVAFAAALVALMLDAGRDLSPLTRLGAILAGATSAPFSLGVGPIAIALAVQGS
jgi:hypothetical protein